MTRSVLVLTLLAVAAILVAPPAMAAAKSFNLTTTHVTGGWVFVRDGTNNPVLNVDPGDSVTVNLTNTDPVANVGPHNFKVTGITGAVVPATGLLSKKNDSAQVTFTIPNTAGQAYEYLCEVHPATMKGQLKVSGTAAEAPKGTPGFEVLAALAAVAGAVLLLRRR